MKFKHGNTWIVLASGLWALGLAADVLPILRGDFGWRWPYEAPKEPGRLLPLLLALLLYLVGAWWLRRRTRALPLVSWSVLGGVVLTIAGLYVRSDPLFELYAGTVDPGAAGWHYAAARIEDTDATLRDWPAYMVKAYSYSAHVRLSPPGQVMIYHAANQVFAGWPAVADRLGMPLRAAQCHNLRLMTFSNAELASAWLGMLMPVWGALTVVPLYRLGHRLFGDEATRWSVIWWPLTPAVLMFAPAPNTFYPFLAVMTVALLVKGVVERRMIWVLMAGCVMSCLTFLTLSVLPLLGVVAAVIVGRRWVTAPTSDFA